MKTPEEIVKEITQCFTGNGDYFFEYLTPEDCLGVLKQALSQHDVIKNEVSVCDHSETENLHCEVGWSIEGKRCKKCKQTVL